jgi:hypothetical protein
MNRSANVRSLQAIRDFKVAMANFGDDGRNALSSVEMEIRRTRDWLQREQYSYWQTQVKRRTEEVSIARTELHRRRISQQGSDSVSDTEQKENLRLAQRRLDEAERKVALIKKWIPVLDNAIAEYHSAAQPLGDRLTGTFVSSIALLERMVVSIESYLTLAAPEAPPDPGNLSTAAGSAKGKPAPAKQAGSDSGADGDAQGDAAPAEPEPTAASGPEAGTEDEESPTQAATGAGSNTA